MYTTSIVLADAEEGTTVILSMAPSRARAIIMENFEALEQFRIYLNRGGVAGHIVDALAEELSDTDVTSGSATPPRDQLASAADLVYRALDSMPTISPYSNNLEAKIRRIAYGALALKFLAERARMLGEAVLSKAHIPDDAVIQAALVVFDDLQPARV